MILFFYSFSVNSKNYYVSSLHGNDTWEGSIDKPFKTISRAAYMAIAGDSVIVSSGTYREWVSPENGGLSKSKRIIYLAKPGEDVYVKGSEIINKWKKVSNNLWKVTLDNSFFGDFNPYRINVYGDWLNKGKDRCLGDVFIDGSPLLQNLDLAELKSNEMTWYVKVENATTTIWCNPGKKNPNKSLTEISVRPACFFPKSSGVDYITVRGFKFSQASPQWAPPTAEQQGMVGPNWSKGWIIEDCEISYSKCVGISLGKTKASGHNLYTLNLKNDCFNKNGFSREIESILNAEELGWNKENVGSHIIRNNLIHHCGQAGIVGHMGCAFSTISGNEIHSINTGVQITGAETAGIKLHASIDVTLENNFIRDSEKGIWLDWQAQGTHVRNNLFCRNKTRDLFIEVSHGPTMVYNNIFLSKTALFIDAQGIAFFNNLVGGKIILRTSNARYTPYHEPHSTHIKGFYNNSGGDLRFYNNIFACGASLDVYNEYPKYKSGLFKKVRRIEDFLYFKFPIWFDGNVYFKGSTPHKEETGFVQVDKSVEFSLKQDSNGLLLVSNLDFNDIRNEKIQAVTSEILGSTIISESEFENTDGTSFVINYDYWGRIFDKQNYPGPFNGSFDIPVWRY